jgi:S-formylglutathione hydrolase FrmB
LEGKGIAHEWILRSGTHDWKFWQECLPKVLEKVGLSFK